MRKKLINSGWKEDLKGYCKGNNYPKYRYNQRKGHRKSHSPGTGQRSRNPWQAHDPNLYQRGYAQSCTQIRRRVIEQTMNDHSDLILRYSVIGACLKYFLPFYYTNTKLKEYATLSRLWRPLKDGHSP